jgi:hypothetical protein
MSDLLAIIEDSGDDERLVEEIVRRHPDRVIVLLDDGEGEPPLDDDSPRSSARRARLSTLLAAIERTGAVVVGLAGSREQLLGWRFDRIVGASGPTTAL